MYSNLVNSGEELYKSPVMKAMMNIACDIDGVPAPKPKNSKPNDNNSKHK